MSAPQQILLASAGGGGEDTVVWDSANKSSQASLSAADREIGPSGSFDATGRSTVSRSAGLKYFECKVIASSSIPMFGICNSTFAYGALGQDTNGIGIWTTLGWVRRNAVTVQTLSTFAVNDIVNVAVNFTSGKIWFGKNGTWTGDPAAGTGEASASLPSGSLFVCGGGSASPDRVQINAETSQLVYSPPSGFEAWAVA